MSHVILLSLGMLTGLLVLLPNRRAALWYAWPIAIFMIPTWMEIEVSRSLTANSYNITESIIFLGLLIRPDPDSRFRLRLADLLIVLLTVTIGISMARDTGLGLGTIPSLVLRWTLPYLMGRCLLKSPDEIRRALGMMMVCALLLAVYSGFEAITGVNLLSNLFGIHLKWSGERRWGLERAHGMSTHPIYYGMIVTMILPWAIEARRLAKLRQGPFWWLAMPVVVLGAVFVSMSRSVWVSSWIALGSHFFFTHRRWRIPLLVLALVGGAAAVKFKEQLVDLAHMITQPEDEPEQLIIIDGEPYVYTGSRHRLLLFIVYKDTMLTAGAFGHGTDFHEELNDEVLENTFKSIDDHYIYMIVIYGYASIVLFVLLSLTVKLYLLRIAWPLREPYAPLAGSLFGVLLGLDVMLLTVWFAPSFGTVWLFTAGASTCLYELSRQSKTQVGADLAALAGSAWAAAPTEPAALVPAALPGPSWPR
jgi:hypothetical protein